MTAKTFKVEVKNVYDDERTVYKGVTGVDVAGDFIRLTQEGEARENSAMIPEELIRRKQIVTYLFSPDILTITEE